MRGLLSPNDMKEAMDRASTKKVPRSLEGLLLKCIPTGRGLQVSAGKVRLSGQHDGEGRDPALLVHDQVQLVHRDEDQL